MQNSLQAVYVFCVYIPVFISYTFLLITMNFTFIFKIVQLELGIPTMHDALGYNLRTVFFFFLSLIRELHDCPNTWGKSLFPFSVQPEHFYYVNNFVFCHNWKLQVAEELHHVLCLHSFSGRSISIAPVYKTRGEEHPAYTYTPLRRSGTLLQDQFLGIES